MNDILENKNANKMNPSTNVSPYEKYLANLNETLIIKQFCYLGRREMIDSKLNYLTKIAEPEPWIIIDENNEVQSVIRKYFYETFEQCFKQSKIVINDTETVACFNTGLLTSHNEEIYAMFHKSDIYEENSNNHYWFFKEFLVETDGDFINLNIEKPKLATYYKEVGDLFYDPSLPVTINYEHIYEDNLDRLVPEFQKLTKETVRIILNGLVAGVRKKLLRNPLLPLPQYYNDEIRFLIPVDINSSRTTVLVLKRMHNQYVVSTILTPAMAYMTARVVAKPEGNWLFSKIKPASTC